MQSWKTAYILFAATVLVIQRQRLRKATTPSILFLLYIAFGEVRDGVDSIFRQHDRELRGAAYDTSDKAISDACGKIANAIDVMRIEGPDGKRIDLDEIKKRCKNQSSTHYGHIYHPETGEVVASVKDGKIIGKFDVPRRRRCNRFEIRRRSSRISFGVRRQGARVRRSRNQALRETKIAKTTL